MTVHERLLIQNQGPEPDKAALVYQGYIEYPLPIEAEHELAQHLFDSLTPAERDLHGAILARLFPDDLEARGKASVAMLINDYLHGQVALVEQLDAQFALGRVDAA